MIKCDNHGLPMDRMVHGNQFFVCLRDAFGQVRDKYDLKKIELQIIMYLAHAGEDENTASDLVKNMHMNKGQVSKTLDALNKRGYVYFKADEKDRRFVHYYVGDSANPVLADIEKAWNYLSNYIFKDVTKEEQEIFFTISKKMHKNVLELSEMEKFTLEDKEDQDV